MCVVAYGLCGLLLDVVCCVVRVGCSSFLTVAV